MSADLTPTADAVVARAARRRAAGTRAAFDLAMLHEERARWDGLIAYMGEPTGVTLERTTVPDGPPVAMVVPPGARRDRVALYLHPGGYVQGSLDIGVHNAARFARAGGLVLCAVGYRRAPEHPFPAALDDALRVLGWLGEQGFAPAVTGVLGESAGGGLALATLVAARDRGLPLPAVAAVVSPWGDLTGTATGQGRGDADDPTLGDPELTPYARLYAGDEPADNPLISPVFASLHDLPPLLVAYGEVEMLAPDSERIVANARSAGTPCEVFVAPDRDHCFTTLADGDEVAQQGVDVVAGWLTRHLG